MVDHDRGPTSPTPIPEKRHANDRIPLHNLSKELGVEGLTAYLDDEMSRTDWSDDDKALVRHALVLMLDVHQGQTRDDGQAYATHPLRNALRYLTPERLNIRDKPHRVAAILLHDTIEDNPWAVIDANQDSIDRRTAQQLALEKLWEIYSPEVAICVALFTIPPYPREDMTPEEKRQHHYAHRKMVLELDSDIGLALLPDPIDNGMANEHEVNPVRRDKQMRKYIPELPLYEAYVERMRESLTPDALRYLEEVFSNVKREHMLWQRGQLGAAG